MDASLAWQSVPALPALEGRIAERYRLTAQNNLAVLDWEHDFLRPFTERKGFSGGYVGLGKTLEALTRMAAYTRDRKLLALRKNALAKLEKAQGRDGYLGIFRPAERPHATWDVHEMAYMLMALTVDYSLFGDSRVLRMAVRLGRYLLRRVTEADGSDVKISRELTTLGLDRALLALFNLTGDRDYIVFLEHQLRLLDWQLDIVLGRHGIVAGHAYAYLTRCMAQLELYRATGDRRLLIQTRKVWRHLFDDDGLLITGTCGVQECWDKNQTVAGNVGETCATAYLIRLADMCARMEGHGRYADLVECALYNALFAAQSPDGRKLRYYVPLQGARVYWPKDTYCCPGNFRRIMAELPGLVYHCRPDDLRVDLYESSRLELSLNGVVVKVRQRTGYPADGLVTFTISPMRPVVFNLRLRVPAWCADFELAVNGKPLRLLQCDGYVDVQREWRRGDRVELMLAMPHRFTPGTKTQAGRFAVTRGPLVYCADPADSPAFSPADFTRIEIMKNTPRACRPAGRRSSGWRGTACRVRARQIDPLDGHERQGWLHLTEFNNPGGQFTFFPAR